MRFVPVKGEDQRSVLLIHRARELLVRQRTQLVNALRGHLAEFGVVATQGITRIKELLALVADPKDRRVPPLAQDVLSLLVEQLRAVEDKVVALARQLVAWHRTNKVSRRLATIPGVGSITATALVATVGDPAFFTSARHFAAPRRPPDRRLFEDGSPASWRTMARAHACRHSSGGREWLGGISKRGDAYLRRLLVHGARSILHCRRHRPSAHQAWIDGLLERRLGNVVTVALASKTAWIAWAVMARGEPFRAHGPA